MPFQNNYVNLVAEKTQAHTRLIRDYDGFDRDFDYIVVGLYDFKNSSERTREKQFWHRRLTGTKVFFSEIEHVYPRTHIPFDSRMIREKKNYRDSICTEPVKRLIIHYDGNVALCCEDMKDEFDLGNAF